MLHIKIKSHLWILFISLTYCQIPAGPPENLNESTNTPFPAGGQELAVPLGSKLYVFTL